MALYARYLYPQIGVGAAHKRPLMPLCFTKLKYVSENFDIHSVVDSNRMEYWEVDETKDTNGVGELLTLTEVEQEIFGVGGYSTYKLTHPEP